MREYIWKLLHIWCLELSSRSISLLPEPIAPSPRPLYKHPRPCFSFNTPTRNSVSQHKIQKGKSEFGMASSLALRRAASSALINRLANPFRAVSAARSFNTNAQMTTYDEGDRGVDVDRRSVSRRRDSLPSFFSDPFGPFSPSRSVNQLLNLMDQLMENPLLAASQGMGAGTRRGWDVREDDKGLYMRIDMPGLDKEHVKISVEQNTLIIRGEGEKDSAEEEEEDDGRRRYSSRLDLPPNLYKVDGIKAEMKNGVLKVVVPKVKEEERKDVYQVKIE